MDRRSRRDEGGGAGILRERYSCVLPRPCVAEPPARQRICEARRSSGRPHCGVASKRDGVDRDPDRLWANWSDRGRAQYAFSFWRGRRHPSPLGGAAADLLAGIPGHSFQRCARGHSVRPARAPGNRRGLSAAGRQLSAGDSRQACGAVPGYFGLRAMGRSRAG